MSYHVLGERPIHAVSAKFQFGTICEFFTRFSIVVLVVGGVGGGGDWRVGWRLTYSVPSPYDIARTVDTNMRAT